MIKLTEIYHKIIRDLGRVNIAVDMTCGHGNDTLILSEIADRVYAFDIQALALEKAKEYTKLKTNIKFIHDNHDSVSSYITDAIDLVIYNLGYLPGSDKKIQTQADSTINSLKTIIKLLSPSGLVILEVYSHNLKESEIILNYSQSLDHTFDVLKIQPLNKINAPFLIIIKKKSA